MKNRVYEAMNRFFDSVWYPVVYAAICVVSGVNGKAVYVPMACLLATLIILSCFFAKNKRSFIAPVLMSFYCIGADRQNGFIENNAELLGYYDMGGFLTIITIGVIAAAFLFVRVIRMGVFQKDKQGKGNFLWGILLMDAALLLNGVGSADWQPVNLLYGFIFSAVLTFFYLFFRGCFDTSGDDREYICSIVVLTSLIAMGQILYTCVIRWQEGSLFVMDPILHDWCVDRNVANLGWGVSTSVGGMLVLGVPAAMYLAAKSRRGWLWYLTALALTAASLIPRSRSSMFMAILFLGGGAILGCFCGENRKTNRWIFLSLCATAAAVFAAMLATGRITLDMLNRFIRIKGLSEDVRWTMWTTATEHFFTAPVFGVGFEKGAFADQQRLNNVFSNMYHGIIPEFYGAMGILGICAFAKHLFDLGKTVLRRFSAAKLLLAAVPGMILMMSLVDNFFFYANYQFVYCLFLALLEKSEKGLQQ